MGMKLESLRDMRQKGVRIALGVVAAGALASAVAGCGTGAAITGIGTNVTNGKVNSDINNQISQPTGSQAGQALPLMTTPPSSGAR